MRGDLKTAADAERVAALMKAVAEQRDRAAFRTIFAGYAPRLKAFLGRGGLDDATAEELVQEVMLTVWRRAQTFDPGQGSFAAWLFTIARNRRIDYFRRAPKPLGDEPDPMLLPEPQESAEGLVEASQNHRSVRAAMEELPPEQVQVLRMAFFEQKSHSEIAAEQGLPLGTVKSRIRLAMRQMRRTLERET
jgi:RNA polymerase sigma factor (sigma-70 family)